MVQAKELKTGRSSTKVDLRVCNGKTDRPFYPELFPLAQAIEDDLRSGIPGCSPMSAAAWGKKFGRGVAGEALSALMRQIRMPSIEVLIRIGYSMKQAGADVEIYDYLLTLADGIWAKIADELEDGDEVPSHTGSAIPHKADVVFTTGFLTSAYSGLPWGDRLALMQPLLDVIARDTKFIAMQNELDVIRELVREAIETVQTVKKFVERTDAPYNWVKNILEGRWDEVRNEATVGMVLKLADKVKNLDGQFGDVELFAPLLDQSLQGNAKSLKALSLQSRDEKRSERF